MRDRRVDPPPSGSLGPVSGPGPGRSGASPASGADTRAGGTGTKKKKILIVDDSFTSLEMQHLTLSTGAYEIISARDGREAIKKAVAERPDLILMDVNMPNMDGFQALKVLRKVAPTKDVPIIMMTTRNDETSMTIGRRMGCTDYLIKPLDSQKLLDTVKTHLKE